MSMLSILRKLTEPSPVPKRVLSREDAISQRASLAADTARRLPVLESAKRGADSQVESSRQALRDAMETARLASLELSRFRVGVDQQDASLAQAIEQDCDPQIDVTIAEIDRQLDRLPFEVPAGEAASAVLENAFGRSPHDSTAILSQTASRTAQQASKRCAEINATSEKLRTARQALVELKTADVHDVAAAIERIVAELE
jgi:hypothetical protein